jgi:hypothetical protein
MRLFIPEAKSHRMGAKTCSDSSHDIYALLSYTVHTTTYMGLATIELPGPCKQPRYTVRQ